MFDGIKELKILINESECDDIDSKMLNRYLNSILCKYFIEKWDRDDLSVEELREKNMIKDLMDIGQDTDIHLF